MILYKSAVTIARPPEAVFPYLVEPALQAKWSDVPMRQLTDGPLGPGSQLEVTFGMGPIKAKVGLQIVAVEPGRRFAWQTFKGPILSGGRVPAVAIRHVDRAEAGRPAHVHQPVAAA